MAEQQRQDDDAKARAVSKLEVIVLESFISPSQEEQLRQIPEWEHFETQEESPSKLLPSSQQTTPTSSRLSAQDKFTVGCRRTMIYTPTDTQNSDEKDEEEEQPPASANDDDDSFEPKFESDRDCSLSTQPQNFLLAKSFALDGLILNDHSPSPVRLELSVPEPSSVSSKRVNINLKSKKKINPKPAACRRITDEEEEKTQTETTHNAEVFPDIVEESPVDVRKRATQLGAAPHIDRFDNRPTPNFSQIDTQLAPNLHTQFDDYQIPNFSPNETQLTPNFETQCSKGYNQTDREMPFSHNLAEEQKKTSEGEEIRAGRILPTYFTTDSVQKNILTDLEKDTETGQNRDSQSVPKRQRKEPKPFPKTLMDVIMHFSGEPPVGFEDADIVEAAIKAGYTFPLPLSRHRYQT